MAPTSPLELTVITPQRQVLQTTAQAVVLPVHDGELGVLHQRAPLVCELGIGQLRYTAAGQTVRVFIDGGFAQVLQDQVTVLTRRAIPATEITPDLVKEEERVAAGPPAEGEDRSRAAQRAFALRRLLGGS